MSPRIVLVPPSAQTAELARAIAPTGFELVMPKDDPGEIRAVLDKAEYMICYPHVKMDDAFHKAAPQPQADPAAVCGL